MGYGVPDSGVDFVFISVRDAYLLMKSSKAVFVDARDKEDYDKTRLQTSWHLSANDLFFQKEKIPKGLVDHLIELAKGGKTIVCLSDSCITGNKNRGHVSRCRHIAQYIHEVGGDETRDKLVRMIGGLNEWKAMKLDGIIGDQRRLYAGAWVEEDQKVPAAPELPGGAADETDDVADLEGARAQFGVMMSALSSPNRDNSTTFKATPAENSTTGSGSGGYPAAKAAATPKAAAAPPALPANAEICDGCKVKIKGLKARPELNGQQGTVMCKDEAAGRFEVLIDGTTTDERVRVKPDNLDLVALPTPAAPSAAVAKAAPKAAPAPAEEVQMITICCGGDMRDCEVSKKFAEVPLARPRPPNGEKPTCYRMLRGEIYKKPSKESDKIIKIDRPVSSLVRTTGETWVGNNGGNWAELDTTAGEKKGWVYIEGPGFGPSTRKIRTEYLTF